MMCPFRNAWFTVPVAVAVILSAAVSGLLPAQEPPDPSAAILRHIERLGAEDFAEREAASNALLQAGPPARRLLEAALRESRDPEVQLRARTILAWLDWGIDNS